MSRLERDLTRVATRETIEEKRTPRRNLLGSDWIPLVLSLASTVILARAAPTRITSLERYEGEKVPRPEHILVYDFAARSLGSRTAQEIVLRIRKMGLPAERAVEPTSPSPGDLISIRIPEPGRALAPAMPLCRSLRSLYACRPAPHSVDRRTVSSPSGDPSPRSAPRLEPTVRPPLNRSIRHIVTGLAVFGATCLAGVVGYRIAGWDTIDAVYMVVITIFGVGYGEVRPIETPAMRIFTSGLIVAGYGAAVYAVGGFVQFITEGEINRALGARRMTRQIQKFRDHTIVCGYGRFGRILAGRLVASGADVVVVDQDPARIVAAEAAGLSVVSGDASDESVLETAGIRHAATLAAVLPSDSANVFVTLTATGMNRHVSVLARAENPASESKLRRSGADHVILPAAIGADRIANLITHPSAEELLLGRGDIRALLGDQLGQLGLRIEELTVPASSPLIGQPLRAMEIGGNHGFLVIGIVRASGEVAVNPDDSETLGARDKVIVIGHSNDLPELRRRYELAREYVYRGARLT